MAVDTHRVMLWAIERKQRYRRSTPSFSGDVASAKSAVKTRSAGRATRIIILV
jgi:hypothetical protein